MDIPQIPPLGLTGLADNSIRQGVIISHDLVPSIPQRNDFMGKVTVAVPDVSTLPLSPLGTPVMQNITFKGVSYKDPNTGQQRTTKDLTLINILLTVSQAKRIICTEIPGMNGTIKEYIGLDDFDITINGMIVGTNGHNPTDETIALKEMMIANVTTEVHCTYLNNLGISNVVIKEFTLDQDAGEPCLVFVEEMDHGCAHRLR